MSQLVAQPGVRWRLGAGTRKGLLVLHIASAGAWLGMDLAMAVLIVTALTTDNITTKATSFQALELVAVWPLLASGLVCLASGVLLGLGSKYGLVRYWWVMTKLILNLVLTGLVLIALAPPGDRGRRAGPAVPGRGAGDPDGGGSDLPAHRVPDGPAGGDGPGRVQTLGPNPSSGPIQGGPMTATTDTLDLVRRWAAA
ncbi:MAG TPA: hypothetical protein VGW74_22285, partial [Propionibacteriaceae bacterium]|nr:hypothetical protein [Propionibacteriaceae bacterium]